MGTADRHICNIVIYFEAMAMGKADQHIFQHRYFDSKGTAKQHILRFAFNFDAMAMRIADQNIFRPGQHLCSKPDILEEKSRVSLAT